jgi:hypothetical protein
MRSPVPAIVILALGWLPIGCRSRAPEPTPAAGPAPVELDQVRASQFAALSLGCVDRPYPNKPGHTLDSDTQVRPHRELTPAFFGCFDWHSAVHGHWALVRLLRRFPALPEAARIRAALLTHLTPENLARELAFFKEERSKLFERPYGWGWLLRLAAELESWDDPDARRMAAALAPLAAQLSSFSRAYLERLSVPVREGTHQNTAFALVHLLDYARVAKDQALAATVERRARDFYGNDRDCPTAYEPSGEDFLSPCLTEADLMRRVLPAPEFVAWLGRFLPPLDSARFAPLREPVEVRDLTDPRIGHLIGLALQRAWCFEGIARALPAADPRRPELERLAAQHRERGLREMQESGYGGEHWLSSFAIYGLTEGGGS